MARPLSGSQSLCNCVSGVVIVNHGIPGKPFRFVRGAREENS